MEILLPQEIAGSATKVLCQGKVVQVEKEKPDGRTSVVCTVENYHFAPAVEAGGDSRQAAGVGKE